MESLFQFRSRMDDLVEAVARALYETDSGHDGYPPLHESQKWEDVTWRDGFYDRARVIVRKLEAERGG